MKYDLVIGFGWLPRDVDELTLADIEGISRAGRRRDARAKGRR